MKQLLQNAYTGEITVDEVPAPARDPRSLLVATRFSVISPGTERAVVEVGRASLVGKARSRPDLAKKVIESARTDGVVATYAKVRGRLAEPNALGYSLSGTVLEAGEDAPAGPGELVACAGARYASHAEVVAVPRLLCAPVPEAVAAEDAAYATLAAIALHGVRLTGVGLGDVAAVVGLGLVGQLTLELLVAAGAVAIGVDPDERRAHIARDAGFFACTDPAEFESEILRLSAGRGADASLVTAASRSSAPLRTAIAVARERAVVCIVGDVKIESPRAPMFGKEVRLVVSRSYGPGRYDPMYEERGIDYPPGYVRWTEGRNLEEVLRLMATRQLRPSRLTSHTFELEQGARAYALLTSDEPSLGILLRYPKRQSAGPRSLSLNGRRRPRIASGLRRPRPRIGVVGAGTFARSVLMPALARQAEIAAVATATGASARSSARRFHARTATTEAAEVLRDPELDGVVIATRHDTHAAYAAEALRSGKHVFVEKPLALDEEQLAIVERAAAESSGCLQVGFNRRFAPLLQKMRDALGGRGPLVVTYRVNAGRLPRSHWTHDPELGGGRIVGEACHFVDAASFLAGGPPSVAAAVAASRGCEPREDVVAATLTFPDGSIAQIVYSALGDPSLPKERIEVLGEAGTGVLDDFRELQLFRGGREAKVVSKRDKGHLAELAAFVESCRSGQQVWPVADMTAVTGATFAIRDAVRAGVPAQSLSTP
jgi:predicted dehydrogenase/threonine dehydrogenase-like Zn-dependent dehydrogenase